MKKKLTNLYDLICKLIKQRIKLYKTKRHSIELKNKTTLDTKSKVNLVGNFQFYFKETWQDMLWEFRLKEQRNHYQDRAIDELEDFITEYLAKHRAYASYDTFHNTND
jgi:hypothetical protein